MHRLETLLESTVDKSFDKFEIYVLRNILTVDEEVGGWVRLGHYQVSPLSLTLVAFRPSNMCPGEMIGG